LSLSHRDAYGTLARSRTHHFSCLCCWKAHIILHEDPSVLFAWSGNRGVTGNRENNLSNARDDDSAIYMQYGQVITIIIHGHSPYDTGKKVHTQKKIVFFADGRITSFFLLKKKEGLETAHNTHHEATTTAATVAAHKNNAWYTDTWPSPQNATKVTERERRNTPTTESCHKNKNNVIQQCTHAKRQKTERHNRTFGPSSHKAKTENQKTQKSALEVNFVVLQKKKTH